jgi:hypothetical protein
MKTATLTYPIPHFIDLTPLSARFDFLTRAVLILIDAGQLRLAHRCSQKIVRLVREFSKLSTRNILLARKLDMLSDAPWRARVLTQLGGLKRLEVWERARQRVLAQGDRPLPERQNPQPSWLYTPERLSESERLKAHVRKCARATASPYIVRDRVRVDRDGLFRLPPLPRLKTGKRQLTVYTQNSISDYDFNAMPFYEPKGLGPAMVWPAEFYAAMRVEAKIGKALRQKAKERSTSDTLISDYKAHIPLNLAPRFYCLNHEQPAASKSQICISKIEDQFPTVSPLKVMSVRNYRYIFETPI